MMASDLATTRTGVARRIARPATSPPEAVSAVDRAGMTCGLRREPRIDGIRHFTAADYF